MNSPIKFLRRVRIHGGECGAVARALHHKAESSSLPAVFENVSNTTIERKYMTKLTFKRLALVVVTALGLGLFASGPTNAVVASSDTLTASATTATVAAGETATVSITQTFVANLAADSLGVQILNQSTPAASSSSTNGRLTLVVTDSANAIIRTTTQDNSIDSLSSDKRQRDMSGNAGIVGSDSVTATISSINVNAATTSVSATYTLRFHGATTVGTYVYRILPFSGRGGTAITPVAPVLTWTVTVTENASNVGTTASKFWLNRATEYGAYHASALAYSNPETTSYKTIETDSALVVNAGSASTPAVHAVITPVIMNSSDTKVSDFGQS